MSVLHLSASTTALLFVSSTVSGIIGLYLVRVRRLRRVISRSRRPKCDLFTRISPSWRYQLSVRRFTSKRNSSTVSTKSLFPINNNKNAASIAIRFISPSLTQERAA